MQHFFTLKDEEKKELMSITARLKNVAETTLKPQVIPADLSPEQIDFAETHNLPYEFFQFFEVEGMQAEDTPAPQKAAQSVALPSA